MSYAIEYHIDPAQVAAFRAAREDQRIELAVQSFRRGTGPPRVEHLLMVNLRDLKT